MRVTTTNFGEIKIKNDKVINFKKKILGFEEYTKFTMIDPPDDDLFYWLQSITEPDLSFIIVNPLNFVKEYKVEITDDFRTSLQIEKESEIGIYSLVNIPEDSSYIAINLKAPVIINASKLLAGQLVQEQEYPIRHFIYQKE